MFLLTLLGSIGPVIGKVLEAVLPDPRAKAEVQKAIIKEIGATLDKQKDIIMAELQGDSWIQRNWRAVTGLSFSAMVILIVLSSELLRPYIWFLFGIELPYIKPSIELWNALFICLGGYMTLVTVEKVCQLFCSVMRR